MAPDITLRIHRIPNSICTFCFLFVLLHTGTIIHTLTSLDLARNCLPRGCFRATATTIVLAQRRSNAFIEPAVAEMLEEECGRAVLTAIAAAK